MEIKYEILLFDEFDMVLMGKFPYPLKIPILIILDFSEEISLMNEKNII
jgi:hypothetical protein